MFFFMIPLDNNMMTRNRLGQDFQQRASEHEFGHMLGVPHIECDPQTGTYPSHTPVYPIGDYPMPGRASHIT